MKRNLIFIAVVAMMMSCTGNTRHNHFNAKHNSCCSAKANTEVCCETDTQAPDSVACRPCESKCETPVRAHQGRHANCEPQGNGRGYQYGRHSQGKGYGNGYGNGNGPHNQKGPHRGQGRGYGNGNGNGCCNN